MIAQALALPPLRSFDCYFNFYTLHTLECSENNPAVGLQPLMCNNVQRHSRHCPQRAQTLLSVNAPPTNSDEIWVCSESVHKGGRRAVCPCLLHAPRWRILENVLLEKEDSKVNTLNNHIPTLMYHKSCLYSKELRCVTTYSVCWSHRTQACTQKPLSSAWTRTVLLIAVIETHRYNCWQNKEVIFFLIFFCQASALI